MSKLSSFKKTFALSCISGLTSLAAFAQPANDNCSGAIAIVPVTGITCSSPVSGTTDQATASPEVAPACGSAVNLDDDVWYSFVATGTSHRVALSNITEDMVLAVYSGTCGSLTELDCADDPERIDLTGLTVGATYYCRVWTYSTTTVGTFDICVSDAPPPVTNDECANAIALSIVGGPVTTTSLGATESEPDCASTDNAALDTWYKVTADNAGDIDITADPNGYDIVMQVFSGGCGSTPLDCIDNSFGTEEYTITGATAGQAYYIRVYDYDGGNAEFTISVAGTALPVTMDKLSGSITAAGLANLKWQTYSEKNNKGFAVQRSRDGKTFENIGWVSSSGAQGNSSSVLRYAYTDQEKVTGRQYYRLAQTDIDGKTTLSNTIDLNGNGSSNISLLMQPNPVKDALTLKLSGTAGGNAKVIIRNVNGQVLRSLVITDAEVVVPVSDLAAGIYFLNYTDGANSTSAKFVKQ